MTKRAASSGRAMLLATVCTLLLPSSGAVAAAIQTNTFSGTATVTDVPTGGSTDTTYNYANLTFNKFDTSAGVLKGVSVGLTSSRTQTTSLSGTAPSSTGPKRNNAANSTNAALTAPAVFAITPGQPGALAQSLSCGRNGTNPPPNCPQSLVSSPIVSDASFSIGPLGRLLYVGPGTVGVSLDAKLSAQNTTSGGTWTGASDAYSVSWSGSASVAYSYDQHSDASFNSGTTNTDALHIDFGTVQRKSSPAQQLFDIFNMMQTDPNADGREVMYLNLLASSASGDVGKFDITQPSDYLGPYAAGDGKTFGVDFDTSQVGSFAATFCVGFIDDLLDGGIGHGGNWLSLYLTGQVVPEENNPGVPEPASLVLLAGGLLSAGALRKRRRKA